MGWLADKINKAKQTTIDALKEAKDVANEVATETVKGAKEMKKQWDESELKSGLAKAPGEMKTLWNKSELKEEMKKAGKKIAVKTNEAVNDLGNMVDEAVKAAKEGYNEGKNGKKLAAKKKPGGHKNHGA